MSVTREGGRVEHRRVFDGHWINGDAIGQPGQAVRIDPDTGDQLESKPVNQFPSSHLESDGYRLEIRLPDLWHEHAHRIAPQPGWQLVDTRSDEPTGSYDFGPYAPVGIHGDIIWLANYRDDTLAHLAVSDLIAAAAD